MDDTTLVMFVLMGYFALCGCAYAFGVFGSTIRVRRLPFFLFMAGVGFVTNLLPDTFWAGLPILLLLLMIGALCWFTGRIVGGRLNDAAASKAHAIWGWLPLIWIGLLFFPSKESAQ